MKRITKIIGLAALLALPSARAAIELNLPGPVRPGAAEGASATASVPEAEDYGLLELANGERFKVRLERYDPAAGLLTVRHPFMRGPVQVEDSALVRYSAQPTRTDDTPPPGLLVTLVDGDRIRGDDFVVDANRVRFKSTYGGDVMVPRTAVRSLDTAAPLLLYEGPSTGETWIVAGARKTLDAAILGLQNNEVAARQLPAMPRKMRLDFKVSGSYFLQSLGVTFYARQDRAGQVAGNAGYQLMLSSQNRATLSRFVQGQGLQTVATADRNLQAQAQRLATGLPITVFTDLDEQVIRVFLDGQPALEFKDPGRLTNPGRVLAFQSSQAVIITDVTITQWDGRVPTGAKASGDTPADTLHLKTGDTISGELLELRRGQVSLRTAMGDLTIPLNQVDRLLFRGEGAAEKANRSGVRIELLDGTTLTLHIEKIEDGVVLGRSESAGQLRIPVKAVGRAVWRADGEADEPAEPPPRGGAAGPAGAPLGDGRALF